MNKKKQKTDYFDNMREKKAVQAIRFAHKPFSAFFSHYSHKHLFYTLYSCRLPERGRIRSLYNERVIHRVMNENFPVHFILRRDCTDCAAATQLFIEKPMYTRYNARIDLELQKPKKGAVMLEKIYNTPCGIIRYWINKIGDSSKPSLIFLPGLTADHRLFEKQISYFENKYTVFVWDAPGHASSWPFEFSFSLQDEALWLDGIVSQENIALPVIIGQSMGGYIGQMYSQLFPNKLRGFVSIDSAPLQRSYVTGIELWLLKRMEPFYRYYPWKLLLEAGANGVAVSEYGRKLMKEMMTVYTNQKCRYAKIAGHGYKILADAMSADLPYKINCPALLICGEKDKAGSCIRYNKAWHKKTGFPIEWIKDAGHNSNTDKPDLINTILENFIKRIL